MANDASIGRLDLADAHGCCAIGSTSLTVDCLDTRGAHLRVLRATVEGSGTGPYDRTGTRLIATISAEDNGVIAPTSRLDGRRWGRVGRIGAHITRAACRVPI